MTKPNFLFIGPDQSAATWIYNMMRNHSDCWIPPAKEIYYFDKYSDKDFEWYQAHFKKADPRCKIIGEFSHSYMYSEDALEKMAQDLPDAKLIMCLRHPVERSFAHYKALKKSASVGEDFEKALAKYPEILDHSLYAPCILRVLRYFDASQLQILFYDDLKANPQAFAKQISRFLNISFYENTDITKNTSETKKIENKYLAKLLSMGSQLARNIGLGNFVGQIKYGLLQTILSWPVKKNETEILPNEDREKLLAYFANDIYAVEQLTVRNLDQWRC